jgi:hypothetical protein
MPLQDWSDDRGLNVMGTKMTAAGVAELKKLLPDTEISN